MIAEFVKRNDHAKCWANVLGQCSGSITKEHLITKALYKSKSIHVDGTPWLNGPSVEIGRKAFASNILCKGHNNKLSYADNEAVKLSKAFCLAQNPMKRPNSIILQPPPEIKISGTLFGRWMCKTHCNFLSVSGHIPEISYVQYAFAKRPEKPIFFYFASKVGKKLKIGDEHYKYILPPIIEGINSIYDFAIVFSGLIIIITTNQISNLKVSLIDRLKVFQISTQLGFYKILFDWTDEPIPLSKQ
jgi:hypothetical protein